MRTTAKATPTRDRVVRVVAMLIAISLVALLGIHHNGLDSTGVPFEQEELAVQQVREVSLWELPTGVKVNKNRRTVTRNLEILLDDNVCPAERLVVNWMKNSETCPAVLITPQTVEQIQEIVRDTVQYPSPVRATGLTLSPSNINWNDGGTTLSMVALNTIHGMVKVNLPSGKQVWCIDTEPGVILRDLQLYANKFLKELPFSAEIGLATIGGTVFTTTKDSPIGDSPIPGMGIGDIGSCVFAVTVVEDDGELREYRVMDESGTFDPKFQSLLDSQGSQGIAVRLLLTVRPITPLKTTLALIDYDNSAAMANDLYDRYIAAAALDGTVFYSISFVPGLLVGSEKRIPFANSKDFTIPVYDKILAKVYLLFKKKLIQQGASLVELPKLFFQLGFLFPDSPLVRFKSLTRPAGNKYDLDVPKDERRLTFTYVSFPFDNFIDIVTRASEFIQDYLQQTGFAPKQAVVYFVKNSGKRVAGPYKTTADRSFSFDPTTDDPLDPAWDAFLDAFHAWAIDNGGRPSLNQSPGIEKFPEWGSTALPDQPPPSSRFTSSWLQEFYTVKGL